MPRHVALAIIVCQRSEKVLMITSRARPDLWILPKGGVEDGETSGQAAVREAWEEAGTPKDLFPPKEEDKLLIISLKGGKRGKGSIWHVHVLEVDEDDVKSVKDWPEAHQRQRAWFTLSSALSRINEWRKDPFAAETLEDVMDVQSQSTSTNARTQSVTKGKKDEKGGAMELALRTFAEARGWITD
ncbi:hypothetical protein TREMEDRAFT_73926 [Tremella mesenterica DSM 1558]|uniref:uncharacterized protein n=1 Tax=Tremella mesenterica (strain ATCC 24925 / CBS 8224 / DSM 1558 / NBRC 9311 / NRRL Y-6157 / RJB 2259-6 / UBC 559-6) TaxID=578456 RepID=UPI0003F492CE|nr:uncharacterized protein TREMEDRAFT_73926 [Tremella mesenterica DSM 1558]EIW69637.1 hypothetical protein TREMEDRAFT_73926 [Tremella mesenterica DSM 1558]